MMISMDKEGDSTILFRNSEGIPLAEITFTLCEYQGKRTMFIGGLQGAKWEIPHQEIQNATKACHGLFPKRLGDGSGLSVCPTFAGRADYCVSNETHIYRSLRYRDKEGKIHADYNAFWESVGGVCDAERHYRLPAQIARKEIAEIASKKRAEYRRRYEMLDAIQPQMATMFRGLIRATARQPQHA
ncbi:VirG localization protein VirK [Escherichia coli]|nr:VirG localization protein VirK [Escherichia coli]